MYAWKKKSVCRCGCVHLLSLRCVRVCVPSLPPPQCLTSTKRLMAFRNSRDKSKQARSKKPVASNNGCCTLTHTHVHTSTHTPPHPHIPTFDFLRHCQHPVKHPGKCLHLFYQEVYSVILSITTKTEAANG